MDDAQKPQITKKRIRSNAYPAIGLEEAIQSVDELRKNLGQGPYSRLSAAQALGYKSVSGASATKIAALVHFGLLIRIIDTYRQSPLSDRILIPTGDKDKQEAVIESLKTPKLYSKLINDLQGKSLPSMLPNMLYHSFKINERVTKEVANNFINSIEFVGILKNGVINDIKNEINTQSQTTIKTPSQIPSRPVFVGQKINETGGGMSIPLNSGIIVYFPDRLVRKVANGIFADTLKTLENLGEGEDLNGKSTSNAADTSVEHN
ncbi:MAG: hypothetical protein WC744_04825 [Patescibacteria group bacterium]|jgi:hypothetical protein